MSLAEPTPVRAERIPADSSVEMTWRTFGGDCDSIYWALLKARCRRDGLALTADVLAEQFRLHLHRGIGYLAGDPDVRSISGLVRKTLAKNTTEDA
jgi:DNA sulfur modification protein DndE